MGFVPTMGFLHEGHLSLMRRAWIENDFVVTSIFVNPAQFGPNEDLAKYPRDVESDTSKCKEIGVTVLFMPDSSEIYGKNHQTYVAVENFQNYLCGSSRPGHFRGVATVVLKLFNIVKPTAAYFGSKDYQQLQVIRAMVKDLNVDTEVIACPTVREADGLAMSSRNSYLTVDERRQALCLHKALLAAQEMFSESEVNLQEYLNIMVNTINEAPSADIDYVKIVDPETLEDLDTIKDQALAILAVKIGKTRLIDNMLLGRNV